MKKLEKQVSDFVGVSMLGAAGSVGVTALGGSAAGVTNATRFLGPAGTIAGAGAMMRVVKGFSSKVPKKRRGKKKKKRFY